MRSERSPKLFSLLAIDGAIVTIDAMGCQRDIAQKTIDKEPDVLALKEIKVRSRLMSRSLWLSIRCNLDRLETVGWVTPVSGDHPV
jgi:predicted transposase YbfD/YdcC